MIDDIRVLRDAGNDLAIAVSHVINERGGDLGLEIAFNKWVRTVANIDRPKTDRSAK